MQADQQHEFGIQRIYIKDISYEAPNTPEVFQAEWKPQIDFNIDVNNKKITEESYEVILQITLSTKINDKNVFLVEIKQAGIFTVKGFTTEQLGSMLGSFCPNILFPYARELISSTINRGGFPPLYLAPINFEALYQEKLQKQK
jgi:preprotein translocase subunit SecB